MQIKKNLYEACLLFTNNRLETVTKVIESNKKALYSETKSSVGDKHETGRAMLQLEMEKASQQLTSSNLMKSVLNKISTDIVADIICLGSLIVTDKATYYLAISAGKIAIDSIDYFAISTYSPIGQQLLGKRVGDRIPFNNATILSID